MNQQTPQPAQADPRPRILVLEDDPDFAALLEVALQDAALSPIFAHSLGEADRELAASGIDFAILDGVLPDGAALEWLAAKRKQGWPVPVVLLSQYYREENTSPFVAALGISRVIEKREVDLRELVDYVRRLLR